MFESFVYKVIFHKIILFSSIFAYLTYHKTAQLTRFMMLHKMFWFFFGQYFYVLDYFIILYWREYTYSYWMHFSFSTPCNKSFILQYMYIREYNHYEKIFNAIISVCFGEREKKQDVN